MPKKKKVVKEIEVEIPVTIKKSKKETASLSLEKKSKIEALDKFYGELEKKDDACTRKYEIVRRFLQGESVPAIAFSVPLSKTYVYQVVRKYEFFGTEFLKTQRGKRRPKCF